MKIGGIGYLRRGRSGVLESGDEKHMGCVMNECMGLNCWAYTLGNGRCELWGGGTKWRYQKSERDWKVNENGSPGGGN